MLREIDDARFLTVAVRGGRQLTDNKWEDASAGWAPPVKK